MAWLTLLIQIKLIAHYAVIYASTLFNIQIILTSFDAFFLYSLFSCLSWSVWFSSIWFLLQIENWNSKIHNREFQCLIPQELNITNLESQLSIFVSKKHKIENRSRLWAPDLKTIFNVLKIKNWKLKMVSWWFLFLVFKEKEN